MTDVIKYRCPILNTEDGIGLDVLVKLNDTKILGIICPQYNSSRSLCKTQSTDSDLQEEIDDVKDSYSSKNFKGTDEYFEIKDELKKKCKFSYFMKKSDKQALEEMIDKKRIELMNNELKEVGNLDVKCILAEGFKELK